MARRCWCQLHRYISAFDSLSRPSLTAGSVNYALSAGKAPLSSQPALGVGVASQSAGAPGEIETAQPPTGPQGAAASHVQIPNSIRIDSTQVMSSGSGDSRTGIPSSSSSSPTFGASLRSQNTEAPENVQTAQSPIGLPGNVATGPQVLNAADAALTHVLSSGTGNSSPSGATAGNSPTPGAQMPQNPIRPGIIGTAPPPFAQLSDSHALSEVTRNPSIAPSGRSTPVSIATGIPPTPGSSLVFGVSPKPQASEALISQNGVRTGNAGPPSAQLSELQAQSKAAIKSNIASSDFKTLVSGGTIDGTTSEGSDNPLSPVANEDQASQASNLPTEQSTNAANPTNVAPGYSAAKSIPSVSESAPYPLISVASGGPGNAVSSGAALVPTGGLAIPASQVGTGPRCLYPADCLTEAPQPFSTDSKGALMPGAPKLTTPPAALPSGGLRQPGFMTAS